VYVCSDGLRRLPGARHALLSLVPPSGCLPSVPCTVPRCLALCETRRRSVVLQATRGLRASGASAQRCSVERRANQVRAGRLCRFRRLYFNILCSASPPTARRASSRRTRCWSERLLIGGPRGALRRPPQARGRGSLDCRSFRPRLCPALPRTVPHTHTPFRSAPRPPRTCSAAGPEQP
jgi:hypothetical protein